jgi:hypothetical protein
VAYSAIVWLPPGDSAAQARLVRAHCGGLKGASSTSRISRSKSAITAGEPFFSIDMRWGPDDIRSNSLLECLNSDPDIDHYAIPL